VGGAPAGVYVKATEGIGYVNPTFGSDYRAARAACFQVGAYHFWHPEESLAPQLDWFHKHYERMAGDLPPAWDAEINPSSLSWADLGGQLKTAVAVLKADFGAACLYVDQSWRSALGPEGFPWGADVWLAIGAPDEPLPIAVQFAPRSWPGFTGAVDVSVAV
jgi:Glycosyl hydrolases family 25